MTSKRDKLEPKSFDFEASLTRLESLVKKLEEENLPLDSALEEFEAGMKLVADTQAALEAAEQRVALILNKDGEPNVETLSDDADPD